MNEFQVGDIVRLGEGEIIASVSHNEVGVRFASSKSFRYVHPKDLILVKRTVQPLKVGDFVHTTQDYERLPRGTIISTCTAPFSPRYIYEDGWFYDLKNLDTEDYHRFTAGDLTSPVPVARKILWMSTTGE